MKGLCGGWHREVAEIKSKLQRMSPVEQADSYHALFVDLVALEAYRRSLLEQASGDDLSA
jgi:DNA primase